MGTWSTRGSWRPFVASNGPVFDHLVWEYFAQFNQKHSFESSIAINLSSDCFILGQRFFHAVLCVELWVSALVDVSLRHSLVQVKIMANTYSKTSGGIFTSWLVWCIRSLVLSISCKDKTNWFLGHQQVSINLIQYTFCNSQFLIQHSLARMRRKVSHYDTQLSGIFNQLLQLGFQVVQWARSRHFVAESVPWNTSIAITTKMSERWQVRMWRPLHSVTSTVIDRTADHLSTLEYWI